MAEDAVTETATAAEEVSKKDDLEALKETAKEKLEAAINGSGGSDNDGDKTEKAGNGATETSATNGHDTSIDETSNGTSSSAKGDEELETKNDDENDMSDKNDEAKDNGKNDKDPSEKDMKSKDVSENVSTNVSTNVSENVSENDSEDEHDDIDELDKETPGELIRLNPENK